MPTHKKPIVQKPPAPSPETLAVILNTLQMTDEELLRTLETYILRENCFTTEVRDVLIAYKHWSTKRNRAKNIRIIETTKSK